MRPMRVFISSAQRELAEERKTLAAHLRSDPLLHKFFDPFLFEEMPAADRRADEVYLAEVEACEIYLGIFGNEYGFEDAEGVSPTERELDRATALHKPRLIFVKGTSDSARHPRMNALVRRVGNELIRRRFATTAELIAGVYAALVQYLEGKKLLVSAPFDAAPCLKASLFDLDEERVQRFVRVADAARGFPLREGATMVEVLTHLSLLDDGHPTHAAVLLFGREPQRFVLSSEVKCAHFHGTEVSKPIPSYQVYKGTAFELVDQAVDFVASKINLQVGTRAAGPQAPVEYEIPREVIAEAIVNAIAHRDYTSAGSVQVMLFPDRLEVWNPGGLPASLSLRALREPHGSVPGNPLLAMPLYLAKYIERMGTGTGDMIRRCREAGLPEPEFMLRDGFVTVLRRPSGAGAPPVTPPVAPPVTPPLAEPVQALLRLLERRGPLGSAEIREGLGLKDRTHVREHYLNPALESGLIELTLPDKPRSRLQKYRLSARGQAALAATRKA